MGAEIALIGAITQVAGALYGGVQQKKAMDAQAQASETQAKISYQKADAAQQAGEIEARKRQKLMAQDIGRGLTGFAGNNVMLENGGSVEHFLDSTTFEAGQDVALERHNARLNAWGFQQEGTMNEFSAKQQRKAGKAALYGSVLGATGSLLSGAGGYMSSAGTVSTEGGSKWQSAVFGKGW